MVEAAVVVKTAERTHRYMNVSGTAGTQDAGCGGFQATPNGGSAGCP